MVNRGSIVSIFTIVLRLGASSISVLNKVHAACSAVHAVVLVILLQLRLLLVELAIYLAMELRPVTSGVRWVRTNPP